MASSSTPCRSPIEMMRVQAIILVILCSRAYDCFAFSPYPINGGCSTAATICKYANSDTPSPPPSAAEQRRKQRHIPRRAMPHIKTSSSAEAATKAGYIIRSRGGTDERTSSSDRHRSNSSGEERRPLRTIRRIVHRSNKKDLQTPIPNLEKALVQDKEVETKKQIHVNKAERVTFKATREASRSVANYPASMLSPTQRATLTEYMTQPVEDYSLLSFHDEEGPSLNSASHNKQVTSRRWFVRRLTHEEAGKYIVDPSCSAVKESNLFRLAVPLKPLIGWDLTPVIDLEVIPPETTDEEPSALDHNIEQSTRSPEEEENRDDVDSPKWRPLKGIRHAVDGARREGAIRPTVKIRSMSVSLLSTKEEVRQLMSKSFGNEDRDKKHIDAKDKDMQVEAIGMVGKVEEWLKPHITFEAELSWQDGTATTKSSVVTVKSSAVTSLTIPKIPNDIIRATVPSAFLVKRLGATLTSKALEICLPRFLRQLERDYYRWSGIE
eukprot:scaffold4659_cov80-Skeletonema_dohrnii-CCMP3373.AAC.5